MKRVSPLQRPAPDRREALKRALKLVLALAVGGYLGALPFLQYLYAVHNSSCPCH